MILGEPKVAFLMDKEISFVLTGVRNFLEEDRVSSVKLDISDFLKSGDTKLPPLIIAEAEFREECRREDEQLRRLEENKDEYLSKN